MAAKKAELSVVERGAVPAPTNDGATILAMIDKIAMLPDVDPARIAAMFEIHQKMQADSARKAYYSAFSAMQPKLPIIERKGTIKNKAGDKQSGYPKWEDVVEQIMPVLAEHGFALSFRPKVEEGKITVVAILMHREGHSMESDPYSLPADMTGSKNAVQAIGSSTSYGKRYTSFALLNIVSRDPADGLDDDGKAGGGEAAISQDQLQIITKLLEETMTEESNFMAWVTARFKYPSSVGEIRAKDFDEVKAKLEAKRAQLLKGAGR